MIDAPAADAVAMLADRCTPGFSLASMTTYRVGGRAAGFVRAGDHADVAAVAEARRHTGVRVLTVGRGSNLLVADAGFDGIAMSIADIGDGVVVHPGDDEPGAPIDVTIGGGVALPVAARKLAAAGITGFEWAVGVPGSIGGAVRMNAGGHGSDMAESLVSIECCNLQDGGDVTSRPASSLGLRFRGSDVTSDEVVMTASLRLRRGRRADAQRLVGEIVRWRRANQPGGQNAGSVFVNPVPGEVSAGVVIDGLGLRGLRIGSAWVSEKHANFIQASQDGRASDVRAVMEEVRERVAEATGFHLRSEIRLVGFGDEEHP